MGSYSCWKLKRRGLDAEWEKGFGCGRQGQEAFLKETNTGSDEKQLQGGTIQAVIDRSWEGRQNSSWMPAPKSPVFASTQRENIP